MVREQFAKRAQALKFMRANFLYGSPSNGQRTDNAQRHTDIVSGPELKRVHDEQRYYV